MGGLGMGGLCLALYLFGIVPHFWILVLGVFTGALPVISGLKKLAGEFANRPRLARQRREELAQAQAAESPQRIILQVARRNRGVVTPALVSMESQLDLDAAARELEAMARKGHAEMRVRDNGVIDYLFAEFVDSQS